MLVFQFYAEMCLCFFMETRYCDVCLFFACDFFVRRCVVVMRVKGISCLWRRVVVMCFCLFYCGGVLLRGVFVVFVIFFFVEMRCCDVCLRCVFCLFIRRRDVLL